MRTVSPTRPDALEADRVRSPVEDEVQSSVPESHPTGFDESFDEILDVLHQAIGDFLREKNAMTKPVQDYMAELNTFVRCRFRH